MLQALRSVLLVTLLSSPLHAFAALYVHESGPGDFGLPAHNASYDDIFTSYDDASGMLHWDVTNAVKDGEGPMDGYWLVINAGGNPKQSNVNELAIFYADISSADPADHRLWVYAYNGENNSQSWDTPGIFPGDSSSSLSSDGTGFTIDTALINGFSDPAIDPLTWRGASFDGTVGIWFHPLWDLFTSTDDQGHLTQFAYQMQSWYDISSVPTNTPQVPLPSAFLLFCSGLIGLLSRKLRADGAR